MLKSLIVMLLRCKFCVREALVLFIYLSRDRRIRDNPLFVSSVQVMMRLSGGFVTRFVPST